MAIQKENKKRSAGKKKTIREEIELLKKENNELRELQKLKAENERLKNGDEELKKELQELQKENKKLKQGGEVESPPVSKKNVESKQNKTDGVKILKEFCSKDTTVEEVDLQGIPPETLYRREDEIGVDSFSDQFMK